MFFHKSWFFNSANRVFWLYNYLLFFVLTIFGQYFLYLFYSLHSKLACLFCNISFSNVELFFVVFLLQKCWLIWSTNNTVRFCSEHFICHFHFFWPKILCIIFAPKAIRFSRSFFNFYRFFFWSCVFHSLYFGKMFSAYRFNSFDFITATIFSKSSAILLITSFAAFYA